MIKLVDDTTLEGEWKTTQLGVEHTSSQGRVSILIPWARVKEIWFYNTSHAEDLKKLTARGDSDG